MNSKKFLFNAYKSLCLFRLLNGYDILRLLMFYAESSLQALSADSGGLFPYKIADSAAEKEQKEISGRSF